MKDVNTTKIDIEKFIERCINEDNFCIAFDTNIYLNLYEYSPEVTDFLIELSGIIKNKMILPATVKREFERNHDACLNRQRKKFKNATDSLTKPLDQMKDKIKKQFSILKSYKFPEIDELEDKVKDEMKQVEDIFNAYVSEHDSLNEVNDRFLDEDKISGFIEELVSNEKLLPDFNIDEIYLLCLEGEKRYKKQVPPGYEDSKQKTGAQAYGDFFIWKEIIRYCNENSLI